MTDKLRAARVWLAKQVASGYVDESGMHDTDKYPEEGWRHLKELAVDRSCATCRWAEALDPIIIEEPYSLQCRRFSYDAMWRTDANLRMDGALLSGEENDTGDSRVYVAPTFGCVQWEGK
jgi:hypothetical protein